MFRSRRHKAAIRDIVMILAIPLALMSTGYALFTQKLTVTASTSGVTYTSSQNLSVRYSKTVTQSGGSWNYSLLFTVTNGGTGSIGSWQVGYDLPTGTTNHVCTSVTCAQTGMVVTANSTVSNGTLAPGGQTTFTVTFTAPLQRSVLQNLKISGLYASTYQAIPGLTMTATPGARTKVKNYYYWPYTIVVSNNSAFNVGNWRITASWSSANAVRTMPTTVNYTTTTSQIIITSKTSVAKGATFQFVPSLGSTSTSWVLSNYVIEGMP